MDRVLNPKDENEAIYEIYKACRLCGAGAGYKMPIIQNVVDLLGDGVELRQKIKECVQIEVNHTDRMSPLICKLCLDKVNDFYEFLAMCRQTDRRTRRSLGLPLHARARGQGSANCIRGGRGEVDGEPPGRTRAKHTRGSTQAVDLKIKMKPSPASPAPPASAPAFKRITRQHADTLLCTPQTEVPTPPVERSKLKRTRERDMKTETPPPVKKVKMAPEPARPSKPGLKSSKKAHIEPKDPAPSKTTPKPASKKNLNSQPLPKSTPARTPASRTPASEIPLSKAASKPITPKALNAFFCRICNIQLKNSQGFSNHNKKHQPTFTSPKLSCDACEEWFPAAEQALAHHRAHAHDNLPYKCTRCYGYFKLQQEYHDHFAQNLCLSDVKCWECWRTFPTNKLMEEHSCPGKDGRPGGDVSVEPDVQASLLPMQVRIARCDPLLRRGRHVDVARLSHRYGLDSKCRYPYLPAPAAHFKSEPPATHTDRGLSHDDTLKQGATTDSFAQWDTDHSDNGDNSDSETKVDTLSAMSLNTINSKRRGCNVF